MGAPGEFTHGVGFGDDARGTDGEDAPSTAHRFVDVVDLEGDLGAGRGRRHGAGLGAEDDPVVHDLVVDRDDRGMSAGRRHGDTPDAVRGQQPPAFLRAEVTQLRTQQRMSLTGWQIDTRSAQCRDGGAQCGGQRQEGRHARVGRLFLQVRQVLRRDAGPARRLLPAQPLPAAFEGQAPADVAWIQFLRHRAGRGRREGHVGGVGMSVLGVEVLDVRVGAREHERDVVRVRPAHIVGRRSVLMAQSDDLAVAPDDAGRRALHDEPVAKVSSHDRRPLLGMPLYPTCHGRHPPHGMTGPDGARPPARPPVAPSPPAPLTEPRTTGRVRDPPQALGTAPDIPGTVPGAAVSWKESCLPPPCRTDRGTR